MRLKEEGRGKREQKREQERERDRERERERGVACPTLEATLKANVAQLCVVSLANCSILCAEDAELLLLLLAGSETTVNICIREFWWRLYNLFAIFNQKREQNAAECRKSRGHSKKLITFALLHAAVKGSFPPLQHSLSPSLSFYLSLLLCLCNSGVGQLQQQPQFEHVSIFWGFCILQSVIYSGMICSICIDLLGGPWPAPIQLQVFAFTFRWPPFQFPFASSDPPYVTFSRINKISS